MMPASLKSISCSRHFITAPGSYRVNQHRTGLRIDLSRIDFEDKAVYDMLCGGYYRRIPGRVFSQMQTITRLMPRNLIDMAHEVGP